MVIEVLVLVMSLATFVVLSRALGPADYGRYAAAVSLFTILGPFAVGGAGHVAAKRVALGASPGTVWPITAGMTHSVGFLAAVAATGAAALLLPALPLVTVLGLAVAELVLFRLAPHAVLMCNGLRRPEVGALLIGVTLLARLVALASFHLLGYSSLSDWVKLHLVTGVAAVVMVHLITRRAFHIAGSLSAPSLGEYRENLPFSLALAPNNILNNADKTLLTALGHPADGGLYAAGYRIAAMSYMPIMAVIRATYADFFRRGAEGMASAIHIAGRLSLLTGGLGVAAGIGLLIIAPALTLILGEDFRESVVIVQVMAGLPVLKGLEHPAANALTGSDHQYLRVGLLALVAALNVGLNLVLIPPHGWEGAAAATYVSEVVYLAGLWAALLHLRRQEAAHG